MPAGHVRSIDSLRRLQQTLVAQAADLAAVVQQMRIAIRRIETHFSEHLPAYWRQQAMWATAQLQQAEEQLARLRTTAGEDEPGAFEARMRVVEARRRLGRCEQQLRRAGQVALAIQQACAELLGPLADVAGRTEVDLPHAVHDLAHMIDQLSRYAESASPPPGRFNPVAGDDTQGPPTSPDRSGKEGK